jgi:hypothetical protein
MPAQARPGGGRDHVVEVAADRPRRVVAMALVRRALHHHHAAVAIDHHHGGVGHQAEIVFARGFASLRLSKPINLASW